MRFKRISLNELKEDFYLPFSTVSCQLTWTSVSSLLFEVNNRLPNGTRKCTIDVDHFKLCINPKLQSHVEHHQYASGL